MTLSLNFKPSRIIVSTVFCFALLLVEVLTVAALWLLGLMPLYPRATHVEIASPFEFYKFHHSDTWDFGDTVCFETTDAAQTVYEWYTQLGWAGPNLHYDGFGQAIANTLNLGSWGNVKLKRGLFLSIQHKVCVVTSIEVYWQACPPPDFLLTPSDPWSIREIISFIKMFWRGCQFSSNSGEFGGS